MKKYYLLTTETVEGKKGHSWEKPIMVDISKEELKKVYPEPHVDHYYQYVWDFGGMTFESWQILELDINGALEMHGAIEDTIVDETQTWVVTAKSESGDDYGVIGTFKDEPSEEELKALIHRDKIGCDGWAEDDCDGPGKFGSYLYLEVEGL